MQDVLTVDRLEVLVVVDNATDSALTHQNCYPVLTCCLT